MDRKATLLLFALIFVQHVHGVKFAYTAVGKGVNKGVRLSISVTVHQSIFALYTEGLDTTIAPTVTYSLKLSKAAKVGYQAALFGATGTFSNLTDPHAFRFAEVSSAAAVPPKGFSGNAFEILPQCTPACRSDRWCYKTNACDCAPSYTGACTANGRAASSGANPSGRHLLSSRRLLTDESDEARMFGALSKSLRGAGAEGERAARPRGTTEAERQWETLDGLMGRLCDGDIGLALIKDTGITAPLIPKLPRRYRTYYCGEGMRR